MEDQLPNVLEPGQLREKPRRKVSKYQTATSETKASTKLPEEQSRKRELSYTQNDVQKMDSEAAQKVLFASIEDEQAKRIIRDINDINRIEQNMMSLPDTTDIMVIIETLLRYISEYNGKVNDLLRNLNAIDLYEKFEKKVIRINYIPLIRAKSGAKTYYDYSVAPEQRDVPVSALISSVSTYRMVDYDETKKPDKPSMSLSNMIPAFMKAEDRKNIISELNRALIETIDQDAPDQAKIIFDLGQKATNHDFRKDQSGETKLGISPRELQSINLCTTYMPHKIINLNETEAKDALCQCMGDALAADIRLYMISLYQTMNNIIKLPTLLTQRKSDELSMIHNELYNYNLNVKNLLENIQPNLYDAFCKRDVNIKSIYLQRADKKAGTFYDYTKILQKANFKVQQLFDNLATYNIMSHNEKIFESNTQSEISDNSILGRYIFAFTRSDDRKDNIIALTNALINIIDMDKRLETKIIFELGQKATGINITALDGKAIPTKISLLVPNTKEDAETQLLSFVPLNVANELISIVHKIYNTGQEIINLHFTEPKPLELLMPMHDRLNEYLREVENLFKIIDEQYLVLYDTFLNMPDRQINYMIIKLAKENLLTVYEYTTAPIVQGHSLRELFDSVKNYQLMYQDELRKKPSIKLDDSPYVPAFTTDTDRSNLVMLLNNHLKSMVEQHANPDISHFFVLAQHAAGVNFGVTLSLQRSALHTVAHEPTIIPTVSDELSDAAKKIHQDALANLRREFNDQSISKMAQDVITLHKLKQNLIKTANNPVYLLIAIMIAYLDNYQQKYAEILNIISKSKKAESFLKQEIWINYTEITIDSEKSLTFYKYDGTCRWKYVATGDIFKMIDIYRIMMHNEEIYHKNTRAGTLLIRDKQSLNNIKTVAEAINVPAFYMVMNRRELIAVLELALNTFLINRLNNTVWNDYTNVYKVVAINLIKKPQIIQTTVPPNEIQKIKGDALTALQQKFGQNIIDKIVSDIHTLNENKEKLIKIPDLPITTLLLNLIHYLVSFQETYSLLFETIDPSKNLLHFFLRKSVQFDCKIITISKDHQLTFSFYQAGEVGIQSHLHMNSIFEMIKWYELMRTNEQNKGTPYESKITESTTIFIIVFDTVEDRKRLITILEAALEDFIFNRLDAEVVNAYINFHKAALENLAVESDIATPSRKLLPPLPESPVTTPITVVTKEPPQSIIDPKVNDYIYSLVKDLNTTKSTFVNMVPVSETIDNQNIKRYLAHISKSLGAYKMYSQKLLLALDKTAGLLNFFKSRTINLSSIWIKPNRITLQPVYDYTHYINEHNYSIEKLLFVNDEQESVLFAKVEQEKIKDYSIRQIYMKLFKDEWADEWADESVITESQQIYVPVISTTAQRNDIMSKLNEALVDSIRQQNPQLYAEFVALLAKLDLALKGGYQPYNMKGGQLTIIRDYLIKIYQYQLTKRYAVILLQYLQSKQQTKKAPANDLVNAVMALITYRMGSPNNYDMEMFRFCERINLPLHLILALYFAEKKQDVIQILSAHAFQTPYILPTILRLKKLSAHKKFKTNYNINSDSQIETLLSNQVVW